MLDRPKKSAERGFDAKSHAEEIIETTKKELNDNRLNIAKIGENIGSMKAGIERTNERLSSASSDEKQAIEMELASRELGLSQSYEMLAREEEVYKKLTEFQSDAEDVKDASAAEYRKYLN